MIGLSNDSVNQNIWIHSTKNLYYMNTSEEKRNIWIAYVKKGKLAMALDLT